MEFTFGKTTQKGFAWDCSTEMQLRPGRQRESFVDRCTKQLNECVADALGDHNVLICGELVRAIFDHEAEKYNFGDGPGQLAETLTISWLKKEQPNARAGDPVRINGRGYKIKNGYPIDNRDCWLTAELIDCGECK